MNRDDVIRMAREVCGSTMMAWRDGTEMEWEELKRFADLVAAAEREECARLCEEVEIEKEMFDCGKIGCAVVHYRGTTREKTATECADAIRTRGKNER